MDDTMNQNQPVQQPTPSVPTETPSVPTETPDVPGQVPPLPVEPVVPPVTPPMDQPVQQAPVAPVMGEQPVQQGGEQNTQVGA